MYTKLKIQCKNNNYVHLHKLYNIRSCCKHELPLAWTYCFTYRFILFFIIRTIWCIRYTIQLVVRQCSWLTTATPAVRFLSGWFVAIVCMQCTLLAAGGARSVTSAASAPPSKSFFSDLLRTVGDVDNYTQCVSPGTPRYIEVLHRLKLEESRENDRVSHGRASGCARYVRIWINHLKTVW